MASATFRFYDGLNDFLARARRGAGFTVPCAQNATVKHMVEALGVPHTEVALVLVNGVSSALERLLEEGDRVAVYPRFSSFDPGALLCLPLQPPGRLRFVADAHLGALARLLRMAGFDTIYANTIHGDEIEERAMEEGRIVLTRDRELLKRRGVAYGCYVRALRPQAQLREVAERYGLAERARPFTLCLHCNLSLRALSLAALAAPQRAQLPAAVRASQTAFSVCDGCGGVFWKGSHWRRMAGMLESALQYQDADDDHDRGNPDPREEH
jgi:uncharacterized protein with PIN domain/sulfur carrier protein ThiS